MSNIITFPIRNATDETTKVYIKGRKYSNDTMSRQLKNPTHETDVERFHRNLNYQPTGVASFGIDFQPTGAGSFGTNPNPVNAISVNDNMRSGQGMTAALSAAASNGHVDVMNILLKHGANINAMTRHGTDALYVAATSYQPEALELIFSKGPILRNYMSHGREVSLLMKTISVMIAQSEGELSEEQILVLEILIQVGSGVNGFIYPYDVNISTIGSDHYPNSTLSPLIQIIKSDVRLISTDLKLRLFQLLSIFDVDLNEHDPSGNTALHYAVEFKCLEMVMELILAGADVNIRNWDGNTAQDNAQVDEEMTNMFNELLRH
jgi:ankyrin repeat protein